MFKPKHGARRTWIDDGEVVRVVEGFVTAWPRGSHGDQESTYDTFEDDVIAKIDNERGKK